MKRQLVQSLFAAGSLFVVSGQVSATMYNVSPTAPIVHLRTSCTEGTSPVITQANCFTTMPELETWIGNTRKPNASSALEVKVGPGRFGGFTCPGDVSHITLTGSGPENSFIGSLTNSAWGIQTLNNSSSCSELAVSDLTTEGWFWGVLWRSNGNSRWDNVTMRGSGYGWFDFDCPANTRGTHYFFSSRIISLGASQGSPFAVSKGYGSNCGVNWFFGSEIFATGYSSQGAKGIYLNNSEAHVYGGVIRVAAAPGVAFEDAGTSTLNPAQQEGQGLFGVLSANNSELHIHGTGIDVIGNELPNKIAALIATSGGMIHANEASYNLRTGTGGTVTRILDENDLHAHKVHAPYLWAPHPTAPNIISTEGSDIAVVNDGTPRLVIYSNNCASHWFDVGSNACRP
jgi:hypothetical protein